MRCMLHVRGLVRGSTEAVALRGRSLANILLPLRPLAFLKGSELLAPILKVIYNGVIMGL